jgi:hypothetical protein
MKPYSPDVARRRPTLLPRDARQEGHGVRTGHHVCRPAPGPVGNLCLTALPPERDGWVCDRVEAFGLNRPELKLRLGLSEGVSFPRVPGAGCRRHRRRGPGRQLEPVGHAPDQAEGRDSAIVSR